MTYSARSSLFFGIVRSGWGARARAPRRWPTALLGSAVLLASAQQQPPVVTVAKPVVREIVEDDEFVGRFEAVDEVAIRSRVSGYLDEVHFKDGAIVNKGDLLFTIDQRPYQAALRRGQVAGGRGDEPARIHQDAARPRRRAGQVRQPLRVDA